MTYIILTLLLGSGITIHGMLAHGYTNFTVSIDGQMARTPPTIPPLDASSPAIYDFTLYDIQSLPLTYHALNVSLVPWWNMNSQFSFDYAYVNETLAAPASSTSPASSTFAASSASATLSTSPALSTPPGAVLYRSQ